MRNQLTQQNPLMKISKVAICLASVGIISPVLANPTGAVVTHGEASFIQNGNNLQITNANGTIINWQDFSIGQGEHVNFLQAQASSAVLNRVVSNIPTDILGELTSNGRVFVINPNGLVIGNNAMINTAGFVASTLNISDQDFIAGKMKFVGDSGEIENHGYIAAGPGGEVVLIAPSVENHGVIEANDGTIMLIAGREVVLHSMQEGGLSYKVSAPQDRALNVGKLIAENGAVKVFADQIFQQGSISATRASRNADGNIVLEADSSLSVSGSLSVEGQGVEGGDIHLLGDQVDVTAAYINASGEGGGEILIGGDYAGNGDVKNAANTNTDSATVIRADGGVNGDGGRVIVWSDNTTNSYAKITARGGTTSGDGGFVETSGKKVLDFGQAADVSATDGEAGTWLLDPEDIVIDEDHADSISTSLNGGSNVEVRTSDEGEGEGNITVEAPITKTEGDAEVTLTLDAHNRVDVNAPITSTAGPLNVTIKTGRQVASVDVTEQPETLDDSLSDEPSLENETEEEVAVEDSALEEGAISETQDDFVETAVEDNAGDEALEEVPEDLVENQEPELEVIPQDVVTEPEQAIEEVAVVEETIETIPEVLELEVAAEIAFEADAFIEEAEQQIVIAADINTGGGNVIIDSGLEGDTVVSADITTADQNGDIAGDITIEGERIAIVDDSTVDASAESAGEILIGGGQQGQDNSVDNSQIVIIGEDAEIKADGGNNGDGGRVIVFAEETTIVSGDLSARGGSQSGNGGFIETSGLQGLRVYGTPDVGADSGQGGTWLIDPIDIDIVVGDNNQNITDTGGGGFNLIPNNLNAEIGVTNLRAALQMGNVIISTLDSDPSASEYGDINFLADLTFDFGGAPIGNLLLESENDINFTGSIDDENNGTSTGLNVTFNAERDINLEEDSDIEVGGDVTFDAGNDILISDDIDADNISLVAGNDISTNFSSDLDATDQITLESGNDILIDGSLSGDGGITLQSGNDIFVNDRLSAYGDITDSNITLQADNNIVIHEDIRTTGNITISANYDNQDTGGVTIAHIAGTNDYSVDVGFRSQYNSTIMDYEIITANEVTITGASVDIIGNGCIRSGEGCTGGVNLAGNNVSIGTESSQITGNINIRAQADVQDASLYRGGSILIYSVDELNMNASGNINISSSDTVFSDLTEADGVGTHVFTNTNYAMPYDYYTDFNNTVLIESNGSQNFTAQNITIDAGAGSFDSTVTNASNSSYDVAHSSEININMHGSDYTQTLNATNMTIDGSALIKVGETLTGGDIYQDLGANAIVFSEGQQTITVADDLTLNGRYGPGSSLNGITELFTATISSNGSQTINVGMDAVAVDPGNLEGGSLILHSGEILGRSRGGLPTIGTLPSNINVDTLYSTNGLISMESLAGLAINLTVGEGQGSKVVGIENSTVTDQFGLRLESVNWVNNGTLEWESGSIEVATSEFYDTDAAVAGANSTITNNGTLLVNSESGDFTFNIGSDTNSDLAYGNLNNVGRLEKLVSANTVAGSGVYAATTLNMDITNASDNANDQLGIFATEGNLFIDNGGVTQTSGHTVLNGGNITIGDAGSGLLNATGGTLRGGLSDYEEIYTGGTIYSNVTVQDTTIDPGFSPGTLTINGNFDASAGGNTFEFDVYAGVGVYDQLIINGTSNITGNNIVNAVVSGGFPGNPNLSNNDYSYQYQVIVGNDTLTNPGINLGPNVTISGYDSNVFAGYGNNFFTNPDFTLFFDIPPETPVIVDPPDPVDPVIPPVVPPVVPPTVPPVAGPTPTAPVIVMDQAPEPPAEAPAPPLETPAPPMEPEVIVVIVDNQPVPLPPEIVDVLVTLTDEERKAYLESERVRNVLKTVNMCVGTA